MHGGEGEGAWGEEEHGRCMRDAWEVMLVTSHGEGPGRKGGSLNSLN